MNRFLQRNLRTLAVVVGVTALVTVPALGASAASTTKVQYSLDGNAVGNMTYAWLGKNEVNVSSWANTDNVSDGKGAILYINYGPPGHPAAYTAVYDHDQKGAGTANYGSKDIKDSGGIATLEIKECNGGSRNSPQNCNSTTVKNPSYG